MREAADRLDELDPQCPAVEVVVGQMFEMLKMGKREHAEASILGFVDVHKEKCPTCRAYTPPVEDRREEDNRSPAWGGATLGLVVGLIAGFFRDSYWQTVGYAVVIGAVSGFATSVFARVVNARKG